MRHPVSGAGLDAIDAVARPGAALVEKHDVVPFDDVGIEPVDRQRTERHAGLARAADEVDQRAATLAGRGMHGELDVEPAVVAGRIVIERYRDRDAGEAPGMARVRVEAGDRRLDAVA